MVAKVKKMRAAFTFIELIFAIVIIAITVISLPIMNQAISKGIDESLIQEAIFASEARLSEATTYAWDENSLYDVNVSQLSRIINFNNECNATTKKRVGNIHRRCISDLTKHLSTMLNGQLYAVDPSLFNGVLFQTTGGALTNASGYKKDYNISFSITTPVTFGTAPTQDMKKLSVLVYDPTTNNTLVKLSTYIANIGEVAYHKGTY